jgi:histidine ammonia-lyase
MSQARSDRLTNSHLSELPPFLVAGSGANSGFMIPPYVAAALAAENRAHAAPATVHTVSTCAGQEDHVSMGTTAAIKARRAAWNAGHILAVELLCAAQALDFHAPLRPGSAPARPTPQSAAWSPPASPTTRSARIWRRCAASSRTAAWPSWSRSAWTRTP